MDFLQFILPQLQTYRLQTKGYASSIIQKPWLGKKMQYIVYNKITLDKKTFPNLINVRVNVTKCPNLMQLA